LLVSDTLQEELGAVRLVEEVLALNQALVYMFLSWSLNSMYLDDNWVNLRYCRRSGEESSSSEH
jgi:hypothetical protein